MMIPQKLRNPPSLQRLNSPRLQRRAPRYPLLQRRRLLLLRAMMIPQKLRNPPNLQRLNSPRLRRSKCPPSPQRLKSPHAAPPVEKAKVTATQPNSSSSGARRIKDFSYVDSKLSKTAGSDEVKPAKTEKPKPANTSRTEMASEEMKKVVFDQSLVRRKALNNFDHLDRYIVKGDEEEQETKK
ncbi:unnamed protein product [Heterosigma akashiwo]